MVKHAKSKKQVGLDRRGSTTPSRAFPWLPVGIAAVVLSAVVFQLASLIKKVPSIIVLSSCQDATEESLSGRTIAVPANCGPDIPGAYYWYDPSGSYEFKNFAPCQDEEGRVECVPISGEAAFTSFAEWKKSAFPDAVRFTPENSLGKLPKFRFGKAEGPVFFGSGLLYRPLLTPHDIKKAQTEKQGLYNFILTQSNADPTSLLNKFMQLSIQHLCETGNSVNLVHLGLNTSEYAAYSASCVTFQLLDLETECKARGCLEFLEKRFLADKDQPYFAIHFQSFLRILVGLKFGGWIIEPGTLIKTPFTPQRELIFLYDNAVQSVTPTTHVSYFAKESQFLLDLLKDFPRFYNPDCYGCTDVALPKKAIATKSYGLDIGTAEFYLPQLASKEIMEKYKNGIYDNAVYQHFMRANFTMWSPRYAQSIGEDVCAFSNVMYSKIAEGVLNTTLCK